LNFSRPKIIGDKPVDSCFAIPVNKKWTERIVAYENCSNENITDIQILGATGINLSQAKKLSNTSQTWYKTIDWIPTNDDLGPNIICATASSSSLLISDISCFTVLVGVTEPKIVSASPSSLLSQQFLRDSSGFLKFNITFNVNITKPKKSAFIRIYSANTNKEVLQIDTSKLDASKFVENTLLLDIKRELLSEGEYYVLFDYGVGAGSEYCKPISAEIKDPSFWRFTIFYVPDCLLNETIANELASKKCNLLSTFLLLVIFWLFLAILHFLVLTFMLGIMRKIISKNIL
jgi:hypothetical protein